MNQSETPNEVRLYLDKNGDEYATVDASLYAKIVALGPWYIHAARKCLYVRSWRSGHRREYLHHVVQRLLGRRRPSEEHVVRHLNGDTFVNTGGNLRWGTKSKNRKDVPYVERNRKNGEEKGDPEGERS